MKKIRYWGNEQFDVSRIFLYFGLTNIIFADCIYNNRCRGKVTKLY